MVKLHLFSGFENPRLGIERVTPLGHLYSDRDTLELEQAARELGVPAGALQCSRGFYHFDLWGEPLARARFRHQIVDSHELYQDILQARE